MSNLWLKLKIWTKVGAFALVLVYVIIFVERNSSRQVTPWFWFNVAPQTTVLLLVLYAFLAGVLVTVLLRTTVRTIRQVRELQERQRAEKLEREVGDMRTKAAMLRPKSGGVGGAGDMA